MSSVSSFPMALQQGLSFSAPLMRMDESKALFWPGCALMQYDPQILYKTMAVLRRCEPALGLSGCCCGQPSRFLFAEAFPARQEKLKRKLAAQGVERIYTACPNCTLQMRALDAVEVIPVWRVLAEHIEPSDLCGKAATCALHDPCPMRMDTEQLDALRALCAKAGASITEPAHSRAHTRCCGNFHMMRNLDPAKSAALRQSRIAEFPADLPVASCCAGCLDAFSSEGLQTLHILELLFGRSPKKNWRNRLAFTLRAQPSPPRPTP